MAPGGQLGNGSTGSFPMAVTVSGLSNATALSAGARHTCALRGDGTVRCWGANDGSQLGDGTTTDRSTPVTVAGPNNPTLTRVTAIAAGGNHTCAMRANGTAHCWGENGDGQLGDGTTTDRNRAVTVVGFP